MDGTRYTRPSMEGPPLPLDICLKPFVQLDNGNLVGPFKESDDAAAYMVEIREADALADKFGQPRRVPVAEPRQQAPVDW